MKLCYLNRADTATLDVSPAADADAPVTYLQNDARGYVMTVSSTGAVITGDWGGTAYAIGCMALWRHNLAATDTWRLQLYSDVAMTTQVYDSTATAVGTLFADWDFAFSTSWFAEVAGVKAFKVTLAVAASGIDLARLVLGPALEAPYNPRYGLHLGYADNGAQDRTGSGALSSRAGEQWRTLAFDMFVATEADRAAWLEVDRACGRNTSILLSVFAGNGGTQERDHCLLGKFTERPGTKFGNYNMFDLSVRFEEL